ncbi:hypothetical protein [Niabella aurantiaca]|uniref:hypothetical protein n=1 Tax=Niabella aurantiaca TaxID=379900 RepID=UPI00035CB4B6|nr:hypothetical protein [Niabella aurantiaca]
MLLLPISIIAIAAGLLVFLLLNRPAPADPGDGAKKAGAELARAKAVYEELETRLFAIIEKGINKKYTREIRDGEVTIGMPSELLLMAWGHPSEIKEEGDETEETWIYPAGRSTVESGGGTEVRISGKKVQGWKDN